MNVRMNMDATCMDTTVKPVMNAGILTNMSITIMRKNTAMNLIRTSIRMTMRISTTMTTIRAVAIAPVPGMFRKPEHLLRPVILRGMLSFTSTVWIVPLKKTISGKFFPE